MDRKCYRYSGILDKFECSFILFRQLHDGLFHFGMPHWLLYSTGRMTQSYSNSSRFIQFSKSLVIVIISNGVKKKSQNLCDANQHQLHLSFSSQGKANFKTSVTKRSVTLIWNDVWLQLNRNLDSQILILRVQVFKASVHVYLRLFISKSPTTNYCLGKLMTELGFDI